MGLLLRLDGLDFPGDSPPTLYLFTPFDDGPDETFGDAAERLPNESFLGGVPSAGRATLEVVGVSDPLLLAAFGGGGSEFAGTACTTPAWYTGYPPVAYRLRVLGVSSPEEPGMESLREKSPCWY